MTIKIINNSKVANIYPVLQTGKGPEDHWMQAIYGVQPQNCLGIDGFPRAEHLYRLYINPTGKGIQAGQSVTLTLPLFSKLVPNIDPTKDNQFIDWWQGGSIKVFYNPKEEGMPPAAFMADYMSTAPDQKDHQKAITLPKEVTCAPSSACTMKLFQDTVDLHFMPPLVFGTAPNRKSPIY